MAKTAKKRAYDSSSRKEAARLTHQGILDAARDVFLDQGYAAATMPAIAQAAGVALDTVYAAVGKKPALFRLLVETAISGKDGAVPAEPDRGAAENIGATGAGGRLGAVCGTGASENATFAPPKAAIERIITGTPSS